MIRFIDLQFNNFCNKSCSFCPPQSIYKEKKFKKMSDSTFNNIIKIIKEGLEKNKIAKNVRICTNRYWEPLSDVDGLIEKTNKIKEILPDSLINLQSNGILFNEKIKEKLQNSKIDELELNLYNYDLAKTFEFIKKYFNECEILNINKSKNRIVLKNKKNKWYLFWDKDSFLKTEGNVKNRGSVLLDIYNKERVENCYIPYNILTFEYDGTLMPCCDVYSKVPLHNDCIYGNVNNITFDEIYSKLKSFDWKEHKACKFCNAWYSKIYNTDKVYDKGIFND
jgi:hypothetical protein